MFGLKLTREDALAHAKLGHFWHVVDFVVLGDEQVHSHVYHRA